MSATKLFLVLSSLTVLFVSAGEASAQPANGRFTRGAGEPTTTIKRAGTTKRDMGFEPYSGSYLPRHEGPLSKEKDETIKRQITEGFGGGECNLVHQVIKDNANKDTAAKLDEATTNATGRNTGFKERYKREGYSSSAETWEGFCHNWAPAGLANEINFMVNMDRIYADVPFGIGDMRELATFTYPGDDGSWGSYSWYGKRHNDKDKPEPEADQFDFVDVMSILENNVGPGKPGIVFDVDPGYMVWNQPFYAWERKSTRLTGADMGPKKPPQGGRAYRVEIDAKYGLEGQYGYRGETISGKRNWVGYVYVDKNGKVVDSAWDKAASDEIPDFAWMNKKLGDNADWARLKKIAAEGVSVKDIEAFCTLMASLPAGNISDANAKKLNKLLDKICSVLDQNKLNDYIRKTAERTGQDYTNLEAKIRSTTEGHI